jgi:hypothetical protein
MLGRHRRTALAELDPPRCAPLRFELSAGSAFAR